MIAVVSVFVHPNQQTSSGTHRMASNTSFIHFSPSHDSNLSQTPQSDLLPRQVIGFLPKLQTCPAMVIDYTYAGHRSCSLSIPMIEVHASREFHPISKALFIPGFYHEFLLTSIPELSSLPMEPLNWEFGVRCDRPFHRLQQPRIGTMPKRQYRAGPVSTDFFLEQQKFWDALPGVDPYKREDKIFVESGPLKSWCEPTLEFLLTMFWILKVMFLGAFEFVELLPSLWKRVFGGLTWELALSVLVAMQIVHFLPGMEGRRNANVGDGWPSVKPIYILMIPSSNAISKYFSRL